MKPIYVLTVVLLCSINALIASELQTKVIADCGSYVTIKAIPEQGHYFVRWDDGDTNEERKVEAQKNKTHYAFFAQSEYTITFKNWDGTVLQSKTYKHGDAVTLPTQPTREADEQYTYEFDSWSPNVNYTAVENTEYTAVYNPIIRKYTITFVNWNDAVLEAKEWEYGQKPTYAETPTRPADDGHTYTFSGWSPNVVIVSGEATYKAQYEGFAKSYDLVVSGEHGTTTGSGTYLYGTMPTITAVPDACYRFVKWDNGDTNPTTTILIEGDTNIKAIFELITYTIEVVSNDETQGKVSVSKE